MSLFKLLKRLFNKKGPEYYLSPQWQWSRTQEEIDFLDRIKGENWPNERYDCGKGSLYVGQPEGNIYTWKDIEPSLHKRLFELEGWYWPEIPLNEIVEQKYLQHPMLVRTHACEDRLAYWSYYYGKMKV